MDKNTPDIDFLGSSPISRLKTLMKTLRDPVKGCPWDRAQSFAPNCVLRTNGRRRCPV